MLQFVTKHENPKNRDIAINALTDYKRRLGLAALNTKFFMKYGETLNGSEKEEADSRGEKGMSMAELHKLVKESEEGNESKLLKTFPIKEIEAYCVHIESEEGILPVDKVCNQFLKNNRLFEVENTKEFACFDNFEHKEEFSSCLELLTRALLKEDKDDSARILMYVLCMFKTLKINHDLTLTRDNCHKVFGICLRLSCMLLRNTTYSNKDWGAIIGLESNEVERLDKLVCNKLKELLPLDDYKEAVVMVLIMERHYPYYMI